MEMEFTGERYVPSMRGEIFYEHVHRYAITAPSCAGKRVLDLASGEGWGSALLARNAADVIGIDIDAASIEHARRKYYVPNLRFVHAPATDIPLPDASIDVIASFETIEHLSDHDRMLDEFRRVLAPDGMLFISSPNKLVYSDQRNYANSFHARELYYQEFRDLLKRRFANVAIYGQRFVTSSILHPLAGTRGSTRPGGMPAISARSATACRRSTSRFTFWRCAATGRSPSASPPGSSTLTTICTAIARCICANGRTTLRGACLAGSRRGRWVERADPAVARRRISDDGPGPRTHLSARAITFVRRSCAAHHAEHPR